MTSLYRSTAVQVSANPDPRWFGSRCLTTPDVRYLGQLCREMLNDLEAMASYQYNIRFFPDNHVSLVVGGAVDENPSDEEVMNLCELFFNVLNQFNWFNPQNPRQKRFTICGIVVLCPEPTREMTDVGRVTMAQGMCDCSVIRIAH